MMDDKLLTHRDRPAFPLRLHALSLPMRVAFCHEANPSAYETATLQPGSQPPPHAFVMRDPADCGPAGPVIEGFAPGYGFADNAAIHMAQVKAEEERSKLQAERDRQNAMHRDRARAAKVREDFRIKRLAERDTGRG